LNVIKMQLLQSCILITFKRRIQSMTVPMMMWLILQIKWTSFVARIRSATMHLQQKSKLIVLFPSAGKRYM
jgi:hypothetical protein